MAKATVGRGVEALAQSLEERCALEGVLDQIRNITQVVVSEVFGSGPSTSMPVVGTTALIPLVGPRIPCIGEQSAHQYTLTLVGKRLKKGVSSEPSHSTSTSAGQAQSTHTAQASALAELCFKCGLLN